MPQSHVAMEAVGYEDACRSFQAVQRQSRTRPRSACTSDAIACLTRLVEERLDRAESGSAHPPLDVSRGDTQATRSSSTSASVTSTASMPYDGDSSTVSIQYAGDSSTVSTQYDGDSSTVSTQYDGDSSTVSTQYDGDSQAQGESGALAAIEPPSASQGDSWPGTQTTMHDSDDDAS